jgi:single-strand DNA-binding protein
LDDEGEEMAGYSSTTVLIPIATVGRTPELKTLGAKGTPKCDLWVAVDHWSGKEKRTEWYSVTAWAHLGEIVAEYAEKGSKLFISGHLRSTQYEAKDGSRKRSLEIVADEVRFLSPRRAAPTSHWAEPQSAQGRRSAA